MEKQFSKKQKNKNLLIQDIKRSIISNQLTAVCKRFGALLNV
jgi:hypothetical protein